MSETITELKKEIKRLEFEKTEYFKSARDNGMKLLKLEETMAKICVHYKIDMEEVKKWK